MKYRRKMSKRGSRKQFKKKSGSHPINHMTSPRKRGGIRM